MPNVQKNLIVPYTAVQMFDLVNDIEAYPEYLPWCQATEVHERSTEHVKATIHLAKGPLNYSITTSNTMQPHSRINMQYVAGPFKSCNGSWSFLPKSGHESEIIFAMEYQFTNMFTAIAVEPIFNPIANSLIEAFLQRAEQTYGR